MSALMETMIARIMEWAGRAKEITARPENIIDETIGESLRGEAGFNPDGTVMKDPDGQVLWAKLPKVGTILVDGIEQRVLLADQLTIREYHPGWETPVRLVYELRRVATMPGDKLLGVENDATSFLLRVLSMEFRLQGAVTEGLFRAKLLPVLLEQSQAFVSVFFPFHESVGVGHRVGAPVPVVAGRRGDAGNLVHQTPILIQFNGAHEHTSPIQAKRGTVRLFGPDGQLT